MSYYVVSTLYRSESERDQSEETHSDHEPEELIHSDNRLREQTCSNHDDATQSDHFSSGDDFMTFPPWSQTTTIARCG